MIRMLMRMFVMKRLRRVLGRPATRNARKVERIGRMIGRWMR